MLFLMFNFGSVLSIWWKGYDFDLEGMLALGLFPAPPESSGRSFAQAVQEKCRKVLLDAERHRCLPTAVA
jgi:hypothetical protein